MITIENGLRIQTPSEGMILKQTDTFSKMVYLGEGAGEWEEVLDSGQLEPLQANIIE